MRQLTEAEQAAMKTVLSSGKGLTDHIYNEGAKTGFAAGLDHVQPKFDAIQAMLTGWRQYATDPDDPDCSLAWHTITQTHIKELEAILNILPSETLRPTSDLIAISQGKIEGYEEGTK